MARASALLAGTRQIYGLRTVVCIVVDCDFRGFSAGDTGREDDVQVTAASCSKHCQTGAIRSRGRVAALHAGLQREIQCVRSGNGNNPRVHRKDRDFRCYPAKMYGRGRVYYPTLGHIEQNCDDRRRLQKMYLEAIVGDECRKCRCNAATLPTRSGNQRTNIYSGPIEPVSESRKVSERRE